MRAFIGVELPDEARRRLAGLQDGLREVPADVKWVEPEHLHITLKFLGEIAASQRAQLPIRLDEAASTIPRFSVALGGLGAFPSLAAPRVIWVGCEDGARELARLAEAIDARTEPLGVPREERPFAAHLTLGRVRSPHGRAALAERLRTTAWDPPPAWPVERVTLYRSELSPSGPRYTVEHTASLRSGQVA